MVSELQPAPGDTKAKDSFAVNASSQKNPVVATARVFQPVNEPSLWQRTVTAVSNFANAVSSMVEPTAHAAETTAPTANPALENNQPQAKVTSHHARVNRAKSNQKAEPQKAELSNHASTRALAAPMSGETVTANIGTLPAGGTVTIKFSVTVNNAPDLLLLNPPRVENQGTVTATGGINVLTDDTDAALVGVADKTATRIDFFDTTTTLASNLNPSNFGDNVTFTATINETPVQGTANPAGTVDFIDTNNGNAVICDNVAVTGGSAQCQTSALTADTHDIRADYSGDGNFDPSQSNIITS